MSTNKNQPKESGVIRSRKAAMQGKTIKQIAGMVLRGELTLKEIPFPEKHAVMKYL